MKKFLCVILICVFAFSGCAETVLPESEEAESKAESEISGLAALSDDTVIYLGSEAGGTRISNRETALTVGDSRKLKNILDSCTPTNDMWDCSWDYVIKLGEVSYRFQSCFRDGEGYVEWNGGAVILTGSDFTEVRDICIACTSEIRLPSEMTEAKGGYVL